MPQLGGADLRSQNFTHLVESKPEILQHHDAIQLPQLRHRVKAVARLRVGMRRRQQPDLIIKRSKRAETRAILENSPILNMPPSGDQLSLRETRAEKVVTQAHRRDDSLLATQRFAHGRLSNGAIV